MFLLTTKESNDLQPAGILLLPLAMRTQWVAPFPARAKQDCSFAFSVHQKDKPMEFECEELKQLLRESSWTPAYSVDTSAYQRSLEGEGFTLFPAVLDFLQRFGGIQVSGSDPLTNTKYEWFAIDPVGACTMRPLRFYQKLTSLLGQPVCPVGKSANSHMTLLMDAEGNFYTTLERGVYFMGKTVPEAFASLCQESRYYRLLLTVY